LLVGGGDVGGFSSYLNFFSWNEEKFAPLLFIFCFSLSSTNEQRAARAMECVKNASRLHEKLQKHTPRNIKGDKGFSPYNALFF